jgi:hypothetical protein
MRGACIVRSGSGKAHIWFISHTRIESHVWKPRQGSKVGDVRGDGRPGALGSYMVVPPSIHPDTGQPYEVVAGSFDALPVIPNGEAYLDEILAAYRQEVPEGVVPPAPTSRATLTLDADERLRIQAHVRDLRLKQRIKDTLLVPGNIEPGSPHWRTIADFSRSGVDFAVTCELIRKGQTFEQVEQIFAATEIGLNRYLSRDRGHSTGFRYLEATFANALKAVEIERRDSRVAKGQNFEVIEATRTRQSKKLALYHLAIQFTQPGQDPVIKEVDIPSDVLIVEDRFVREVFHQADVSPVLAQNHQGKHNYPAFAQAVSNMVTEDRKTPAAMTREGHLALELWTYLKPMMAREADPPRLADVFGLGWRVGDVYYLKVREVYHKLQAVRGEFRYDELGAVLLQIGEHTTYVHQWPDGSETLFRIERRQTRRALPALPPAP